MKNAINPFDLCEGLPIEFSKYLDYCFNLKFDEDPNYKYLIELFSDLYKAKDYENDYLYDWITAVINYNYFFIINYFKIILKF
jgi:casein kinase I family protein HRR25